MAAMVTNRVSLIYVKNTWFEFVLDRVSLKSDPHLVASFKAKFVARNRFPLSFRWCLQTLLKPPGVHFWAMGAVIKGNVPAILIGGPLSGLANPVAPVV